MMSPVVRPFPFDRLPSVPADGPKVSLEMARLIARLPRPFAVAVDGIGEFEVRADGLDLEGRPTEGSEDFWVEMGGELGQLSLDTAFAAQVVAAVCGRGAPSTIRPLGQAERGVLAAFLLSVLRGAADVRLALRPSFSVRCGQTLAVGFCILSTALGLQGRGVLRASSSWFSHAKLPDCACVRASSVLLPVTIELARTNLPALGCEAVQPSDGIVFEGYPAASRDGDWPVLLRVGELSARATLRGDGTVRMDTAFFDEREERRMPADDRETLVDVSDRILAATPVSIVAELGCVVVRGDELAGLVPGAVLALGRSRTDSIDLRIEGRLWARGELVRAGDELAVRITQITKG